MMMKSIPLVMACFLFTACASSSLQSEAESTYRGFVKACTRHPENAYQYLLKPDRYLVPCPEEGDYPEKIHADIIARSARLDIVYSSEGWQFHTGSFFDPNSLQFSLLQLKYAIFNRDVLKLSQIVAGNVEENALQTWVNSSEAADIYAAIAAHPDPFFVLNGKTAECEVSGRMIRFEMVDGVWKWRMSESR